MASMTATDELNMVRSELRRLATLHPTEAKRIMAGLRFLAPKLHRLFRHYLKGIV